MRAAFGGVRHLAMRPDDLKAFKAAGLSIRILHKVNGGFIVRVGGPA